MSTLFLIIILNGVLQEISNEGLFTSEQCHEVGSKVMMLNNMMQTVDGLDIKYKCITTT